MSLHDIAPRLARAHAERYREVNPHGSPNVYEIEEARWEGRTVHLSARLLVGPCTGALVHWTAVCR